MCGKLNTYSCLTHVKFG